MPPPNWLEVQREKRVALETAAQQQLIRLFKGQGSKI